jgi:archaellum component FlaC
VEDDLRTIVREFRASVSDDIEAQRRRMDDFADEVRRRFAEQDVRIGALENRIATAETAILNEIRDLSNRMDRRFERVENRLNGVEDRVGGVENRLNGVEDRVGGVENRLAGVEDRLSGT